MGSPGRGRRVVIAYSLVAAATQILWLTFAPIDTSAAHHYGVSTDAIGWLAEIFPLLYVVLALPAGRLLDAGFRPALAGGAGLVALGGVLRLGGQTFAWAMAGQVAVAVAQPLILNAVGKLAADYLSVEDRPAGIAVGAGAGFAGMLIALVLGPTLGSGGHVERLLIVEAILALAAAAVLVWELRAPLVGLLVLRHGRLPWSTTRPRPSWLWAPCRCPRSGWRSASRHRPSRRRPLSRRPCRTPLDLAPRPLPHA